MVHLYTLWYPLSALENGDQLMRQLFLAEEDDYLLYVATNPEWYTPKSSQRAITASMFVEEDSNYLV